MEWIVPLSMLLLLYVQVQHASSSCPCPKEKKAIHIQESYCEADYVFVASVKKIVEKDDKRRIEISDIKTHLKYRMKSDVADDNYIYSPHDCKIDIKEGEFYIFSGQIKDKKFWLYECNWYEVWTSNLCVRRHLMAESYENSCDACHVKVKHKGSFISSECYLYNGGPVPLTPHPVIKELNAVCKYTPSQVCKWQYCNGQ